VFWILSYLFQLVGDSVGPEAFPEARKSCLEIKEEKYMVFIEKIFCNWTFFHIFLIKLVIDLDPDPE
jgi:hypothetical protein